ncbi:DUF4421 family protein [Mangrovibacterium diazotrophicum]|uniref:Uncharacterized protein DUF4421 n=1 Tax=Mangrovibacterium diazotrophicum TaxID=1261403 RepID=A0A419W9X9_9BACT|nr:DUF4421 family protein [Mangrovibacterium diazotrophicum]RKD92267.1 uncharacterized protein DUF4421 [Mangrovibacterium diazotrophicum]
MKRGLVILALLCAGKFVSGQDLGEKKTPKFDSNYIDSYYDDVVVRLYTADKGNHVYFSDRANNIGIRYRSNDSFKLGVGVNYKWFGLKVGADLPFSHSNPDIYGKSSSFGLQSYIIARPFILDVVALRTTGYYLTLHGKNANQFDADASGVYHVNRGLKTSNLGVNFIYVLNSKRFSYKAAFNQTDLQKKSAGSLIWGCGLSSFKIENGEAIIPSEFTEQYFKDWDGLMNFHSYSISGSLGYAYSLVPFKYAILTASTSAKFGVRYNQLAFTDENDISQTKPGLGGEVRLSGGYHFPWFYFGASFVQTQFNSDVRFNSLQIANGTSFLEFTISKRIKL